MGVQILNKDVSILSSVLSKPKANIGNIGGIGGWAAGSGFQPGDFNFNDVSFSWTSEGTTNSITFNKSGKLYITGTSSNIGGYCYINTSNTLDFWLNTTLATSNQGSLNTGGTGLFLVYGGLYAVITVNVNDTMYFYFFNEIGEPFADSATVDLRIDSFSGTIIDSFTVTMSG